MICDVYDNVLAEHDALAINDNMQSIRWKYDHASDRKQLNRHWHFLCGRDVEQCELNKVKWVHDLFVHFKEKINFKEKYNIDTYKRIYCNAHTYGVEPHVHTDDGDFTMIYYPLIDWIPEWLGGTSIWNEERTEIEKYVNYKGNRLMVFDAWRPHQAMPVSRQCYKLRSVIVFKTFIDGANRERLNFYKN